MLVNVSMRSYAAERGDEEAVANGGPSAGSNHDYGGQLPGTEQRSWDRIERGFGQAKGVLVKPTACMHTT